MRKSSALAASSVQKEFEGLKVVDARLRRRVCAVVAKLSAAPDVSFPRSLETVAAREAFYRLLSNPRVSYRHLVASHAEQTVERMVEGEKVLVIHDTTEMAFGGTPGSRRGLGHARSSASKPGFFSHVSLAVSAAGKPLGTVGMTCWARKQRRSGKRKVSGHELAQVEDKESARWGLQINEVEHLVGGRAPLLHVMDREADAYPLLSGMVERGQHFVVRVARERLVFELEPDGVPSDAPLPLSHFLLDLPTVLVREVPLRRRKATSLARSKELHPERAARTAKLAISAGRVAFRRPKYWGDDLPAHLELNIVQVSEVNAPDARDAISWVLVTTEPISSPSQIEAVIDHYRQRWLIEEFFKALKTGCDFESRQLESFQTLTNALGLLLPVAWQMLLLRWLSRTTPTAPAETVLSPIQITLLRNTGQKLALSGATVLDALYAVAGLGGHIRNNGPPGWLTLSRGMQDLSMLERGWKIASGEKSATPCDQ
jgi:hypothetical protein